MKLVGVGLTDTLGCGEKEQLMSASKHCLAARCLTMACPDSLCVCAEILPHAHVPAQNATGRRPACSFVTSVLATADDKREAPGKCYQKG